MKKFIAAVALALSLATVFPTVCAAAEIAQLSVTESKKTLDYAQMYTPRAYISPSDLLSTLLKGKDISKIEKDYVDGYFSEYLSYSATLPESLVDLAVTGDSLEINAKAYKYTDKNGKDVTYVPIYATVGGERVTLTKNGNLYSATADATAAEYINVYYNGSLAIPASVANELINFTYNEATDALERYAALSQYGEALAEYKLYLEALDKYNGDLKKYESYLSAKELYDKTLEEYNKSLKDMEEYLKKKAEYDKYASAYDKYLSDMEKYEADYLLYQEADKEYKKYFSNISSIRRSMIAIESLFINGELTRNLYEALQNEELVVMFEKYKPVLVSSLGVSESDIEYLRKYSDELNELLRGYAAAREVSEETAFAYYKQNYTRISELFNNVYDKFRAIINPTVFNFMCGWVELEYKDNKEYADYRKWRVKSVIAQIYLVARCLDDKRTADEKWDFYLDSGDEYRYEFPDLVESELIIHDENCSDPSGFTWYAPLEAPTAPVLPTAPKKVDEPVKPIEIAKPVLPQTVERPVAPTKVEEPTAPDNVDRDFLLRTEDIVTLVDGEDAVLAHRTPLTTDAYISTEIKMTKAVPTSGDAVAYVYLRGEDRPLTIHSLSELPTPIKEYSDARTTYSFVGWSKSSTKYEELPSAISETLNIYPIYKASPRKYTVTFSVDGVETKKVYEVGALPSAEGIDLSKPSDDYYHYTFGGWDQAIRRVSGDVKYTAVEYEKTERTFSVTFNYGENSETKEYTYGKTPESYPSVDETYILDGCLYTFVKWDKELMPISADTVYTAIYESVRLVGSAADDLTLSDELSEYVVSGSGDAFDISELMDLAKKTAKGIRLNFSEHDVSLLIGNGAVLKLVESGAKNATLKKSEEGGIAIGFTDGNQKSVSAPKDGMILRLFHEYDDVSGLSVREVYESGLYRDNIPFEFTEEYCQIAFVADAYYVMRKVYTVSVVSGKDGVAFSTSNALSAGEKIELNIKPNTEHRVKSITVTNEKTGEVTVYSSTDEILMPEGNVTVSVEFEKIYYTVTFIYHGKEESALYSYGEMPKIPKVEEEFVDGDKKYTFLGWSKNVALVEGDAEYTAKYFITDYPRETETGQSAIGAIYGNYFEEPLSVVTIIVVLMIGVLVFIIVKKIVDKNKERSGRRRH